MSLFTWRRWRSASVRLLKRGKEVGFETGAASGRRARHRALTSSRERCEASVDSFSKVPEAGRWKVYIYMDDEVTRRFSTA